MSKSLALLSFVIGVLAYQQPAAAGPKSVADRSCGALAPHAAEIACRDRVAAASHALMLRALAANRRNATALDARYDRDFPDRANDGHRGFAASLNASQAAWEKYAKAQCDYEADKSFGGSGGWDREANCKDRLNRQRLIELRTLLATDRGDGAITRK